jgi:phage shock protein PspC (stress-responsive transcriptional regulator)
MKKITINSNEFELEDTSYSFLQNYLNRTKKYIENNSLDIWLYEDIEERISEKLYSYNIDSWSITEKDVIAIVNEIWESEDIFRDYAKNDSKSKFSPDSLNSWLKKSLYKNSADWVLFWVCQWLWEFFDINPIWIRVFFVVSLLFFWTWILVYILLAIILPNKNQDKADIEWNIKSAADKIWELAANPRIRETWMWIWLVMNRIFMIIW